MGNEITVRQCEAADFSNVIAVINDWWGGRQMSDMLPRLFFDHFNETSFIAEKEGELVGFLIGFLSQVRHDEAYIHFIGVHPDQRKNGLARRLYQQFFEKVWAKGRSVVKAVTSPVNKTSIAFHTRIGFECLPGDGMEDGVPVHHNYDGKGHSRVVFKKELHMWR